MKNKEKRKQLLNLSTSSHEFKQKDKKRKQKDSNSKRRFLKLLGIFYKFEGYSKYLEIGVVINFFLSP